MSRPLKQPKPINQQSEAKDGYSLHLERTAYNTYIIYLFQGPTCRGRVAEETSRTKINIIFDWLAKQKVAVWLIVFNS